MPSASPRPSAGTIAFAAVPYVRTQKPIDLGPWRLWPNTQQDWTREVGADLCWFLEMYRDRTGKSVAAAASVLTRSDGAEATREQFRDAITAFSTLAWLDGAPSADAWIFEVWFVPKDATRGDGFRRLGKFTVNHTDPQHEKVFPGPYVFPITLRTGLPDMVIDFVRDELLKGPENRVLRALGQLHEVRFETPFFTSLGNDVEALWTGFESLLLEEKKSSISRGGRLRRILCRQRFPRRSERLSLAIREQLAALPGLRAETLSSIHTFTETLWGARNSHSHAGNQEPAVELETIEASALSVGLRLFEALLKVRIAQRAGDDIFLLPTAIDRINEIFLRERTLRAIIDLLSTAKPADWYPPTDARAAELVTLHGLLKDLVNFDQVVGWADRRDVAKARGFVRRVLNMWLKDPAVASLNGDDIRALATLPTQDASLLQSLKAQGLKGAALDDALDEQLVDHVRGSDVWRAPALDMTTAAPPLGGVIPLWLWARGYIRLHELFVGYELI